MIYLRPVLKDKGKGNLYSVKIRILQEGKPAYINTPYYLAKDEMRQKTGEVVKNPMAETINADLSARIADYRKKLINYGAMAETLSAIEIKRFLTKKVEKNRVEFFSTLQSHINELERDIKEAAEKGITLSDSRLVSYRNLLASMTKYVGTNEDGTPKSLLFTQIDVDWLKAYRKDFKKRGKEHDAWNKLKDIRALFNIVTGSKLLSKDYYPFDEFKVGTPPAKKKSRNITLDEFYKFLAHPPTNHYELKAYRVFLLNFYMMGINAKDLYYINNGLGEIRNDMVSLERAKTEVALQIKLEPEIKALMDKLRGEEKLFYFQETYQDHKGFGKEIGKKLKKRAKALGITPFTLTTSRYMWSTIASNECGISSEIIDLGLAHETKGSLAKKFYIEKQFKVLHKENRKLIDFVTEGIMDYITNEKKTAV